MICGCWAKSPLNSPRNDPADYTKEWGARGFASQHPDGAVFALCDGSARFVSDLIEFNNNGLAKNNFLVAELRTDLADISRFLSNVLSEASLRAALSFSSAYVLMPGELH